MQRGGDQARGESIIGLARQLITGAVALGRLEVEQGRQEVGEMLATTRSGAVRIGIGLAFLILALIALVVFLVLLIAALTGVPGWIIAAILFIVFLAIGGPLAWVGARRIRIGPPERTMASVREDIAWAKRLLRRD